MSSLEWLRGEKEFVEKVEPFGNDYLVYDIREDNESENIETAIICNISNIEMKITGYLTYFSFVKNENAKIGCGEVEIIEKGVYNWIENPSCHKNGEINIGKIGDGNPETIFPILYLGSESCLWSDNEEYQNCSERNGIDLLSVRFIPGNIRLMDGTKEIYMKDYVLKCN